jgi:hypothetical protein
MNEGEGDEAAHKSKGKLYAQDRPNSLHGAITANLDYTTASYLIPAETSAVFLFASCSLLIIHLLDLGPLVR